LLQPFINQLSPFIPEEKRLTTDDFYELMNLNIDENNSGVRENVNRNRIS
jgi:hypothetical protein